VIWPLLTVTQQHLLENQFEKRADGPDKLLTTSLQRRSSHPLIDAERTQGRCRRPARGISAPSRQELRRQCRSECD
jgi:hypothetical protein